MQFTVSTKRFLDHCQFFLLINPEKLLPSGGKKRNHKYCVTAEVFKVAQRLNTQSASSPLLVTEGFWSGCPFLLVPSSYSSGRHQQLDEMKSQIIHASWNIRSLSCWPWLCHLYFQPVTQTLCYYRRSGNPRADSREPFTSVTGQLWAWSFLYHCFCFLGYKNRGDKPHFILASCAIDSWKEGWYQ